ncbi:MAG: hypothetical protein M1368_08160 [Thaumarchaeota archaeon]|nr:hypothetical protein [Nitrososphaerota archaeon]
MAIQKLTLSLRYSDEQRRVIPRRSHISDVIQGMAENDLGSLAPIPKISKYSRLIHHKLWIMDNRF